MATTLELMLRPFDDFVEGLRRSPSTYEPMLAAASARLTTPDLLSSALALVRLNAFLEGGALPLDLTDDPRQDAILTAGSGIPEVARLQALALNTAASQCTQWASPVTGAHTPAQDLAADCAVDCHDVATRMRMGKPPLWLSPFATERLRDEIKRRSPALGASAAAVGRALNGFLVDHDPSAFERLGVHLKDLFVVLGNGFREGVPVGPVRIKPDIDVGGGVYGVQFLLAFDGADPPPKALVDACKQVKKALGCVRCLEDGLCPGNTVWCRGGYCAPPPSPATPTTDCANGAPNGAGCDDGNACTQIDTCQSGTCVGGSPVVCTALSQCHEVGTCDPQTGLCTNPPKPNGTACDDGNACTQIDTCQSGSCVGGSPVSCDSPAKCRTSEGASCDPNTGQCSYPLAAAGTECSAPVCGAGVLTHASSCDEQGNCVSNGSTSCGAYACESGTAACKNTCSDDSDCGDGFACSNNTCVGRPLCCCQFQSENYCADCNGCPQGLCIGGQCYAPCWACITSAEPVVGWLCGQECPSQATDRCESACR